MRARGYGSLDLSFAALYAYLGFVAAPSRSRVFDVVLGGVVTLLVLAGVTLLVQGDDGRAGRRLGIGASVVLLVFAVGGVVLLAASCAFLLGVYGAIGRGLALLALVAAALVVELCGLLPLFQLRYHLASRPAR